MPLRRLNVRAISQKDDTSSAPTVPPCRVNIPDEGVGSLIEAMIGAFQHIAGANLASAPVNQGLSLERLWALGGKEFSGVKGNDSNVAEYWLEGIERILEQMSCSDNEKLGWVVSLLDVRLIVGGIWLEEVLFLID
ncbi:hypothetical protein V6Z11_D06G160900 [Gossypium hirsutum]